MVTYKNGQILIDKKAVTLLSGEVHYFRLDPKDWEDRLLKLKGCGMNTVATYVPWLLHEMTEGEIDLTGRTDPRLDLKAFIKLCEELDLYLMLRPGPFVMAELKNEGIPYWVYERYPEAIPVGFDGVQASTYALDYTSPGFLGAVKNWYKEIMTLIAEHAYPKGKVIMVQLDNEIGMVSWASQSPDMSDHILEQFADWLNETYGDDTRYPFLIEAGEEFFEACRSPKALYATRFHQDFSRFNRTRYANYFRILREYAIEFGVKDLLFVVNIHGTSQGRGYTYPIGVSQLEEAVNAAPDVIAGSDVYFSEMKLPNVADLYLCNEITAAVNRDGRPLTSVEFGCGDGNYGDDYNNRSGAYDNDFRTRMFLAQGNRLLNYYLFCGGTNWRLPFQTGDGNDRIATTGEQHGFAAPVGPTGILNQTFPRMARVTRQMSFFGDKLAKAAPLYDDIAYGFLPDDYMTEYVYKGSEETKRVFADLKMNRAGTVWDSTMRALLLLGCTPKAELLRDSAPKAGMLILPSSKYMNRALQASLTVYVKNGGKLLLQGRIPRFDEEGKACRILAEALEVTDFTENIWKNHRDPALVSEGFLSGDPELFTWNYESFQVENAETILRTYDTGRTVGFYKEVEKGRVIVLCCEYKCRPDSYARMLEKLEVEHHLTHGIVSPGVGVFLLLSKTPEGECFLHLLNLDDVPKNFSVFSYHKRLIPGGKIHLPAQEALMLPLDVDFGFCKVIYSSLEILQAGENSLTFRNTEKFSSICVKPKHGLKPRVRYGSIKEEHGEYLISTENQNYKEEITIFFR